MTGARASNVFVLCTGRSGSVTFRQAAGHISNFTAAHESRCHLIGAQRLAYPARHIEIDNRLSWLLGRLDRAYGDNAHYVHLVRDPEAVAQSFTKRMRFGIAKAYQTGIVSKPRKQRAAPPLDISRDLVDTVTENIRLFLRDKSHVMTFRPKDAAEDFARFWDWIGGTGDLAAAQAEWRIQYNASAVQERKAPAPEPPAGGFSLRRLLLGSPPTEPPAEPPAGRTARAATRRARKRGRHDGC